jgi:hypothetical protein
MLRLYRGFFGIHTRVYKMFLRGKRGKNPVTFYFIKIWAGFVLMLVELDSFMDCFIAIVEMLLKICKQVAPSMVEIEKSPQKTD